jgi:hypothetical protein
MTETQAINIIKLSLGGVADADNIAKSVLQYALTKASRLRGSDFNREYKAATLVSGTQNYTLATLFGSQSNVWNIQEMWCTDTTNAAVTIIGLDDFNDRAAGGSSSGRPTIGTLHSKTRELRLYPIPDSNYPIEAYVTAKIAKLSDVPDVYHDVIIDMAGLAVKAISDPNVQMALVKEGLKDLMIDSGGGWTGSKILHPTPLSRGQRVRGDTDSSNLAAE